MRIQWKGKWHLNPRRCFSTTHSRLEIRSLDSLPSRIQPSYNNTEGYDLLSLQWPSPPRNVLLVKKENASQATEALIEFARHIHQTYPSISIILEPSVATEVHEHLPFPIHISQTPTAKSTNPSTLADKVDLTTTFGGDGTILRASSLFAASTSVPPILSFSMGTLGFLNEWRFPEHKRAFRELYMSGSQSSRSSILSSSSPSSTSSDRTLPPWDPSLGASYGSARTARVLLRNRLQVSFHPAPSPTASKAPTREEPLHALNEIILHRGASPHLTQLTLTLHNSRPPRVLTTAVADGLIISTPTGSTAYSLSSGGSIVHPLVKGMIVTPICPRSLSFRPLVLPVGAQVGLRLAEGSRTDRCEFSVDGVRRDVLGVGAEVRVWGEEVGDMGNGKGWSGGVPCVMRGTGGDGASGDEGWVGGLNGLLKFNYPFGEEDT